MRAKKIDSNQRKVVKELRKIGVSVRITSMLGEGFPDLIVGVRQRNFLFELKDGNKSKSRIKLTKDQELFFESWCGQVQRVENVDEILAAIGL